MGNSRLYDGWTRLNVLCDGIQYCIADIRQPVLIFNGSETKSPPGLRGVIAQKYPNHTNCTTASDIPPNPKFNFSSTINLTLDYVSQLLDFKMKGGRPNRQWFL